MFVVLTLALLWAFATVVIADDVGTGEQLDTAGPSRSRIGGTTEAPQSFAKMLVPGPGHPLESVTTEATAPTTSSPRLQPAESRAATTPAPPQSSSSTAAEVAAPAVTPDPPTGSATTDPPPTPRTGVRCIVRLHGKGGDGGATQTLGGGVLEVRPAGNASGWGGREWRYFPASGYASAKASVTSAVDEAGCGSIVIDGFSNGAAFAAKLYCRGETFGGRLVGVVVDDPVVDHAVEGCSPAAGVRVALYWTGALEVTAVPGWVCANQDWTCEGDTTIGIDAYQQALGVARKQSPNGTHAPFVSPPELTSWW
jgi:hypothetical protein